MSVLWHPDLQPKQLEFYEDLRQYLFAIGARGSGKTWVIEHLVMQHLWRVNPAKVAIILLTKQVANEGIWEELTTTIYDQWIKANVGTDKAMFGYETRPRSDPDTKANFFRLWNREGGISKATVFPIKRAQDAIGKLLSTNWTMIWLSEAHLYKSVEIYRQAISQLRHPLVPFDKYKLVVDMNPPAEGLSHWFYDLRDRELLLDPAQFPEEWDKETRAAVIEKQKQTAFYRFLPQDNERLDPRRRAEYRATYARSRSDFRRLVLGMDEEGGEPSDLFSDVWDRNRHVFGQADGPESEWQVLAPTEGLHVDRRGEKVLLLDGWDPGDDVNHAWVAAQPWYREDEHGNDVECYDILEEFESLKRPMAVETLTSHVMEKRLEVAELAGFPIQWTSYSDSSVERFRATTKHGHDASEEDEHTDAMKILQASAYWVKNNPKRHGQIVNLIGAAKMKKRNWQKRRVALLQQLLRENRIRVSAHCKAVIRMFEKLRKNQQERAATYIAPNQDEKHIFDALSYLIGMRLIAELQMIELPNVVRKVQRV